MKANSSQDNLESKSRGGEFVIKSTYGEFRSTWDTILNRHENPHSSKLFLFDRNAFKKVNKVI